MTDSEKLSLVLDQGGSSSRAIIFNSGGNPVASAQQVLATERPQPGWVEQSPKAVVESLRWVASEAVGQLTGDQRRQLAVAGLVCQRSSLLAWDRHSGEALTPVLSWQDTRAGDWLAAQSLDATTIQQLTGLYPNAHFGASKMRWCLDHVPALKTAGDFALAPLASYLGYTLLDEKPFLVDPANASRTLLMNLQALDWEPALLQQFGVARSLLPAIVPSAHDYGHLTVNGLQLPFRLLNGDQSAAAFAGGLPCADYAYINIGTGAFMYRVLDRARLVGHLLCSLIYTDGSRALYAAEGTVNGAASALDWFQSGSGVKKEDIHVAAKQFFAQQAQLPLFLNGIGGLGSPDWQADFHSQFIGGGTAPQMALSVLESIAFLLIRNFEHLYVDAPKPRRLVVSGGLSRNDPLCQLLANLSGVEVERVVEQEASARGAAYLLAGDKSEWSLSAGECFPVQDDALSLRRYQQWTTAMEQQLSH